MAEGIDFYFDYSSPYGYVGAMRIGEIAARHARRVRWRPFLIGAVYKATGQAPLENAAKRAYFLADISRHARFNNVELAIPASFPEGLIAAARATYWIDDRSPALTGDFVTRAYRAYWAEGRKLADPQVVADVAAELDVPREETLAALNDPKVKERLKVETDAAIARGVFGSPFVFVGGEAFWGSDRLGQVDEWLARGGW